MDGILNILKPPGMTSQNVVSFVKRTLKVDKAGHTGTLDPGAAGVLPVCLGKASRISEYLLNDKKSYRAEMKIGYRSNTLDSYGVIEDLGVPVLDRDAIYRAFEKFKGKIEQIPPMYSALKQNGVRLYELARAGIEVERQSREVNIFGLNIIGIADNTVMFDVTCSKGTYIRSLCSDIGKSLNSDAVMTFLLRTSTGPFKIENAVTLDELKASSMNNCMDRLLMPIESGLEEYDRIFTDDKTAHKVKNGVGFNFDLIERYESREYDDNVLVFSIDGTFLAVGKKVNESSFIKIEKVFA